MINVNFSGFTIIYQRWYHHYTRNSDHRFFRKTGTSLRHFKSPIPMREVSLVVLRDLVKKRLVDIPTKEIMKAVPQKIKQYKSNRVVPI
ncbi:MAG: hypothetical protein H0V30_02410 [Chitinophagaceae bacterium]|nr:hypothetical protein [Chitinophagaceae bacterium]